MKLLIQNNYKGGTQMRKSTIEYENIEFSVKFKLNFASL